MGLAEIRNLIKPVIKEIELRSLSGKIIAIDAFNYLYQFLAAIRQEDGTPLKDSKGRITSHLYGLFYRTIHLMEEGLRPVFVFDGKHPEFKKEEQKRREEMKKKLEEKYKKVLELGIKKDLRKYAQGIVRLTPDMVKDAMRLLDAMGIPYVQAPSEGEAQAAYMARKGDVYSTASQDYDSLLFGSPRVVRNLAITGKRKVPRKDIYVEIKPELIELEEVLKYLGLTREQLIALALLIGTDYNPDGIPGVGLKTAYELVKKFGNNFEKLFEYVNWKKYYPELDWRELMEFFLDPPVTDNYKIEFKEPDEEKIIKILVEEHDFNEQRVRNAIERLKRAIRAGAQSNLLSFFK